MRSVLATLCGFVMAAGSAFGQDQPVQVEMKTNMGLIRLQLFPDKAPKTVANFVKYAEEGFYNGTIFHRVIPKFMIQGGGHATDLSQKKTGEPVVNESANGLENTRYTIAMARTNAPHSATSQFFINVADNDFLNRKSAQDGWGYCVFGEVTEGREVVDEIARVKTGSLSGMQDVPVDPVVIEEVRIVK
jgi:cyclophilin family peptidyl-prolyl cis-trans isomerase